ncbi:hypothetical protein RHCRD62_20046 [Rhodococcus sp. RD6.2]|nr:hypothetical protein RHCRD62_20046 [Rhodococcus sp. RD6.2]
MEPYDGKWAIGLGWGRVGRSVLAE